MVEERSATTRGVVVLFAALVLAGALVAASAASKRPDAPRIYHAGRPSGELAMRLQPAFPAPIPPVLPSEWLAPLALRLADDQGARTIFRASRRS